VQRGEVLGRTGRTGNAEATRPHLHFELRAPFRLTVKVGTVLRRVDAFDPYPSLMAADPQRRKTPATP
jgi:murein DD-endopeptidase MepM/ murein hydrolase activator NlpD